MKRMRLDWRNVPDLTQSAELYSVSANHESRPVTGNPQGRILVGISPTILYAPNEVAPRPYNLALWQAVLKCSAFTGKEVWRGDNGYSTQLFDLTKRGMLKAWLEILDAHFPWADGFHCDYFSAWSWLFPDMAGSDQKWDDALCALANALRYRKKLVLGQQFHLTGPVLCSNGAFVEQSPYAWHYTLGGHQMDMTRWREMTNYVDKQESIWTYEIREWQNWPQASLDLVKRWAEEQDVYLCIGRDAHVAP